MDTAEMIDPAETIDTTDIPSECGTDNDGTAFSSITQLWQHVSSPAQWYAHSREYWARQDASVEGMLGGFGFLTRLDVRASHRLVMALQGRPDPDDPVSAK